MDGVYPGHVAFTQYQAVLREHGIVVWQCAHVHDNPGSASGCAAVEFSRRNDHALELQRQVDEAGD